MNKKTVQVEFSNSQNPKEDFDMVRVEEIISRTNINHSQFDFHLVKFYTLILIEQGEGIHTIDFTDYECRPGTILSIRKGQIHKFHHNASLKGTALIFTDDFMVSYLDKMEILRLLQLYNEQLSSPSIQVDKDQLYDILELMQRLHREYFIENDDHSSIIIRSELHILITKLFRIKSQSNADLYNRKYLNEFIKLQSLIESNITRTTKVKEYANMMYVSTKTLNNITKEIVNQTAKEFIDEICLNQIKRLLINTDMPIKEVAFDMGFEETSNFYKYFKSRTSSTPEQFRAEI